MADQSTASYTPQTSNEYARDRTMLAHERTLMAWTRTATSLISFGFTIYTFFHNFGPRDRPPGFLGPANYAMIMISIGLLCLFLATLRHMSDVRDLQRHEGAKPRRLAPLLAAMISVLGFLGLLAVILRA
jgi:putative membrane protein